jgi:hypothetical protein
MGVLPANPAQGLAQFRSYCAGGIIAMPAKTLVINIGSPANSALI